MARASGQKDYISMANGLVTEASALAFPEGATADELNFTIDRDGLVRRRRLGFDKLVTDFTVTGNNAVLENCFYWRGPSYVCAIVTDDTPQTRLRIHAVDEDFTFVEEVVIAASVVSTQVAQTTTLLYITTNQGDKPLLCEYDSVNGVIRVYSVTIHIRDFEVVESGLAVSERPATLSDNHKYNLYNGTWYQTKADFNDANTRKNVATAFESAVGDFPSTADVASVGIIDNGSGSIVFDANLVKDAEFGSSLSPRGHFVYPIDNFNRTAKLSTPLVDGAPDTTLELLATVDISSSPTFDPDAPPPSGGGTPPPSGGGGVPPFEKPPYDVVDEP